MPDRFLLDTSAIFALTDREAGADRVEKTFLLAARFKALHRLSFADALIAAAARLEEAALVHKDPEFAQLAGEVDLEDLPLKTRR